MTAAEQDILPEVDIDQELEPGDVCHYYTFCSLCDLTQHSGLIVEALCGQLVTLAFGRKFVRDCPECASISAATRPSMRPCTFCGHIGR